MLRFLRHFVALESEGLILYYSYMYEHDYNIKLMIFVEQNYSSKRGSSCFL